LISYSDDGRKEKNIKTESILNFFNNQSFLKGDWMKKVLLTILGASTLLVALCMIGCGTEPRGAEGKITVSNTSVTGSNVPLTVTLKDPDLTNTVDTLKVTSFDFPSGINLILTGSNGTYTGTLNFSTTVADINTIRVIDGDLVTITYKDAFPAGDRTAKVTWNGAKGTVTLDKATYSSIATPMTITVTDLDMAAPALDVDIITTTYNSQKTTVILKAVAGSYGTYSGKVYFTAGLSAGNDTIRVKDGDVVTVTYNDDVPPGATATATAVWHGVAGIVTATPAAFIGLKSYMTITLKDSDVTDPSVTVKVKSQKDTAGISVVLNPVAGSAGSYSGQVCFSLQGSSSTTGTLAVQNNDTMTISYNDIAPAAVRKAAATWNGASAKLDVDSASYHGTTGKMTITLADDDIMDTSVVVTVKSTKDTVGIPVTLTGSNFSFSGQVGFSLSTSSAGAIAVKDSGTVTVSYSDMTPVETKTTTANWYSVLTPALGIFGPNATPGSSVVPGLLPKLFTWQNTCTADTTVQGMNGGYGIQITGTGGWAGFGWCNVASAAATTTTGINMATYASCTLHVAIKGDANVANLNLLVENVNPNGNTIPQTWVTASTYGYAPDTLWHVLNIPLSAWSATCDFTNLSYFLGVSMAPYVVGEKVTISDLYWTLPQH
jgi:hypothetical protein